MDSGREPPWPALLYGLLALAGCGFAFVGLSCSGFWADELFTMHVIAPGAGPGEVIRRALGDVHPPLYYLLLHAWAQVAGTSEWAMRLPSALFCVLAVGVFALGARKLAGAAAVAFGCAVATGSAFWFGQAQNARSYGLVMLLVAGMLAAALAMRRRWREASGFPWGSWLLLSLLGLAASLTHSYALLVTGLLLLFLLLSLREWRLQLALLASGLCILAAYGGFMWVLWHAPGHDFAHTWFRSDAAFLFSHLRRAVMRSMSKLALLVVLAMLLALPWRRRRAAVPREDAAWAAALCGFVLVGTVVCGMAVSKLLAPSFSDRNVLTCAPFAWLLFARLYDLAGPRPRTRAGAASVLAVVLLLAVELGQLRGRLLPTNESWRSAAGYVAGEAECAGKILPVLSKPGTYGQASPGSRRFVASSYYGYYLPPAFKPRMYQSDELDAMLAGGDAGCPVLAWNEHDMDESDALKLAMQLARRPGLADGVELQEFVLYRYDWFRWRPHPAGFVFLRAGAAPPPAQGAAAGDRVLVRYVGGGYELSRREPGGRVRDYREPAG